MPFQFLEDSGHSTAFSVVALGSLTLRDYLIALIEVCQLNSLR